MTPYIGSHDTENNLGIVNDGTQWNQWSEQDTPGVPPDWGYARLEP